MFFPSHRLDLKNRPDLQNSWRELREENKHVANLPEQLIHEVTNAKGQKEYLLERNIHVGVHDTRKGPQAVFTNKQQALKAAAKKIQSWHETNEKWSSSGRTSQVQQIKHRLQNTSISIMLLFLGFTDILLQKAHHLYSKLSQNVMKQRRFSS